MSNRLLIGNLPLDSVDSELIALFKSLGFDCDVEIIVDSKSGRPKGFAFVGFSSRAVALSAMEIARDSKINGRLITINACAKKSASQSLLSRIFSSFASNS